MSIWTLASPNTEIAGFSANLRVESWPDLSVYTTCVASGFGLGHCLLEATIVKD